MLRSSNFNTKKYLNYLEYLFFIYTNFAKMLISIVLSFSAGPTLKIGMSLRVMIRILFLDLP